GADRVDLPLDRLPVARVLGTLTWETLIRQVVGVLDALDDVNQPVQVDAVAVESHHYLAGHGVDLSPADPVQAGQRRVQLPGDGVTLWPVDALDLDVSPAVARPFAPLTPARRERNPARHRRENGAHLGDHGRLPSVRRWQTSTLARGSGAIGLP